MAIGDYDPNNLDDPLNIALRRQPNRSRQSNFPAVNQINRRNTQFATNAPVNTPAMNLNQIPIGGFGLGALSQAGYSRSPQFSLDSFLGGTTQPSQPTLTGYKWNAGTGGVSGGNNDWLRQYYSDGTMKSFTGGVQDNQPLAPTQYTLPGVNAAVNALSDPSVGALDNATRATNQYGQQVVNPIGGGQIISGRGPSFGSLAGSTPAADAFNRPGLNTPSGGQAFAGPSLRKRAPSMTPGQTYSLGGWY